jgi:uncharacterized membrane protein
MVAIKTVRLLHLLSYLLVTSQVLFYLFILCDSLKVISLENFIELRKVIDSLMIGRFKVMYYSCLALCVIAVVLAAKQPSSGFFITSVMALIFLIADLWITVRGSMPLNELMHTYTPGHSTADWETVRTQWLDYMKYRGIIITMGMTTLIGGLILAKH